MRAPAIRRRPGQVAELTRGLTLPLQAIADAHLAILAEGLQQAFDDVSQEEAATVASGDEAEVTALLEARLNRLVDEDPLWGDLVLCVARGKESVSFDGSHLERRPDLSIYLSDRTRRFPLVAEAKILDAQTGKTVALYCENGIRRFVEGEYAWANHEAWMIGYVRDGSSIDPALRSFLSQGMGTTPPAFLVEELPMPLSLGGSDLASTRHGRNFVYGTASGSKRPGPISIWHLWLS